MLKNLMKFMQQTKVEVSKVTWPNRQELVVTTLMVLAMVFISAIFFLGVDAVLGYGASFLLVGSSS